MPLLTPVAVAKAMALVFFGSCVVFFNRKPVEVPLFYWPTTCPAERPAAGDGRVPLELGDERYVNVDIRNHLSDTGTLVECPASLTEHDTTPINFVVEKDFFAEGLTYSLSAHVPFLAKLSELHVSLIDSATGALLFDLTDTADSTPTVELEQEAAAAPATAVETDGAAPPAQTIRSNADAQAASSGMGDVIATTAGTATPAAPEQDLDWGLGALEDEVPRGDADADAAGDAQSQFTRRKLLKGGGGGYYNGGGDYSGGGGYHSRYRYSWSYGSGRETRTRYGYRDGEAALVANDGDPLVVPVMTHAWVHEVSGLFDSIFGTASAPRSCDTRVWCELVLTESLTPIGFQLATQFTAQGGSGTYTLRINKLVFDGPPVWRSGRETGMGALNYPRVFLSFATEDTPWQYHLGYSVLPLSLVALGAAITYAMCTNPHYSHVNGAMHSTEPLMFVCRRRAIKSMDLSSNDITSIRNLSRFPNLEQLVLRNNDLVHVGGVGAEDAPRLQHLDLSSNDLRSFNPSALTPSLRWLSLFDNDIRSLSPLRLRHSGLRVLRIDNNDLTTTYGIDRFEQLEELHAASNNITALSALQRIPTLRYIDVSQNDVVSAAKVRALALLPNLETLWVTGNNLRATDKRELRDYFASTRPDVSFRC